MLHFSQTGGGSFIPCNTSPTSSHLGHLNSLSDVCVLFCFGATFVFSCWCTALLTSSPLANDSSIPIDKDPKDMSDDELVKKIVSNVKTI